MVSLTHFTVHIYLPTSTDYIPFPSSKHIKYATGLFCFVLFCFFFFDFACFWHSKRETRVSHLTMKKLPLYTFLLSRMVYGSQGVTHGFWPTNRHDNRSFTLTCTSTIVLTTSTAGFSLADVCRWCLESQRVFKGLAVVFHLQNIFSSAVKCFGCAKVCNYSIKAT